MERPSDALFFSEGMLFARPDARAMANAKARDAARDAGAEFPVDVDDVCAADVDGGGGGDALDAGCGVDLLSRRTAEATTAYARAFLEILDARVCRSGHDALGGKSKGGNRREGVRHKRSVFSLLKTNTNTRTRSSPYQHTWSRSARTLRLCSGASGVCAATPHHGGASTANAEATQGAKEAKETQEAQGAKGTQVAQAAQAAQVAQAAVLAEPAVQR